jgi:hypothetical protein
MLEKISSSGDVGVSASVENPNPTLPISSAPPVPLFPLSSPPMPLPQASSTTMDYFLANLREEMAKMFQ